MNDSVETVPKHFKRKRYFLPFLFLVSVGLCYVLGIENERFTSIHFKIRNFLNESLHRNISGNESQNRNISGLVSRFEMFFQKCDYLLENNISIKWHPTFSTCLNLCPKTPPNLIGRITPNLQSPTFEELGSKFQNLKPGGLYSPNQCVSRHKVAIIIAYRNREEHLRILLNNLNPLLQKQELEYGIFVVEQEEGCRFNRAMLMNIGFKEVISMYDYECFIFHDVDHLPENDFNMYSCTSNPRHMAVAVDKFGYNLIYGSYFGGVSALSKCQMEAINGFPNRYFGWGGEDDDIYTRLVTKQYKIVRYALDIARYKTIRHQRDKGNEDNGDRMRQLGKTRQLLQSDGLSTLKYSLLKKENRKLYTWIYVRINETEVLKPYI